MAYDVGTTLYRVEVWAWAWDDGTGEALHTNHEVDAWKVTANTPSGMWIECDGRRVWRKWNTRFAHETMADALESVVARKRSALGIAKDAERRAAAVYAAAVALASAPQ